MENGLVIDQSQAGITIDQQWMEGTAERSIWTGLKTKGKHRFHVVTYRCQNCGYLESYATEDVK
ncbi:MAG: hypothetical protein M3Y64_06615 [Gemmatimonadota bacterium]|nr:hypothetical protein [Gemmatimonadota bacterium]